MTLVAGDKDKDEEQEISPTQPPESDSYLIVCFFCTTYKKYFLFKIFMPFFSVWNLKPAAFLSEGKGFGVGDEENVKEQERKSERLQLHSCEYRFGSCLPLGCLQQANYQASATVRERQKHRLTEADDTLQPQFDFQPQSHKSNSN